MSPIAFGHVLFSATHFSIFFDVMPFFAPAKLWYRYVYTLFVGGHLVLLFLYGLVHTYSIDIIIK